MKFIQVILFIFNIGLGTANAETNSINQDDPNMRLYKSKTKTTAVIDLNIPKNKKLIEVQTEPILDSEKKSDSNESNPKN